MDVQVFHMLSATKDQEYPYTSAAYQHFSAIYGTGRPCSIMSNRRFVASVKATIPKTLVN